ncbi:MAG: hypothetical protein ABIF08_02785 [Nanoarchaeota archaeon]
MDKKTRNIVVIAAIVVIALIGIALVYISSCQTTATGMVCGIFGFAMDDINTGSDNNNNNVIAGEVSYEEALAKCLTDKGVKMYGASWCGHCNNQKTMFGDAFQYVDYVECTEDKAACDTAGVGGYPTWIGSGKSYPGEKSLESLANTFGCDV